MASLHLNPLRASSTMKTTSEAIRRQSTRTFLGNGSHRQGGPSQSMTDFRNGENFNHLKLTAEKMMQEQAGVKSDLQILKAKLQKSEDQVRTLESKLQDMNNENSMLKVKHKQDLKLWQGLDSKFLVTTTFCDELAETLKLLNGQVDEAECTKTRLQDKLAERLESFQQTECRLNDLFEKKKVAEDTVKQCESRNEQLQTVIREMERTVLSDSVELKTFAVEKDDLQQQLSKAMRMNEDNEAILRANRCEIQDLHNKVLCDAKAASELQHLNLTLRQANGELELEVKGLQSILATTSKGNETLQQDLEMLKLNITNLENVNASATAEVENLLAEKVKFMQKMAEDKIAQGKVVHELKQYLIERELDVEAIRRQLQEAMKEKGRLVSVIEKEESKVDSLQDEIKRLSQECTENSQLISGMSQNEANLRRENDMVKEQLTAAENAAKSLEIKFKLQLETEQKESIKQLEDISQRYNQEIADIRRKSVKEIEEAISKERLQGEDTLKAAEKASDEGMKKALEAFDQRWQSLQDDCERRIRSLREGHEKDKMKIVSVHSEETRKQQEELHRANETIITLLEEQEQEKAKIVSVHYDEVRKMEEELQNVKETIRILREGHEQETKRIVSIHADEIHRKEEELQNVQEKIRKLRDCQEQEKVNIVSIHSAEVRKMEEELQNVKETIRILREGQEQDTKRMVSIHADEINKKEVELQNMQETIMKLVDGQEQQKENIVSIHHEEARKMEEELQNANETIRILREGHEKDTKRIVSIHTDAIHKMEAELQNVQDTISKVREGHEQEKTKITSLHAEEIHRMQEELRAEKETRNGDRAESHRKAEEIRKSNQEEMEKFQKAYQAQSRKMTEENSRLHQAMKELQLTHDQLLIKKAQEQKVHFEKWEKETGNVQNSLSQDLNEWRSKALGLEIQLKEALQQITTRLGCQEDRHLQILNEDVFKMKVTEDLVGKDIPTPVVTPMTKDRMPQKPSSRLTVKDTVDISETTDDDAEEEREKPAPQGKRHIQHSPRPGSKRKMNVVSPPEESPRMHGRTSRKEPAALNIHHMKPIHLHQASTESTKAAEVCSSGNKKATSTAKGNESQQQHLIKLQNSATDESRRNIGFTCSQPRLQQSVLQPIPGSKNRKATLHEVLDVPFEEKKTAPKRKARKSTKDISQEKIELSKARPSRAPSPAISDLFEVDGLVSYYKGDDPYAFD